jgi:hypothetical protein
LSRRKENFLDKDCAIRDDNGKLYGYAAEVDGKRYLALFKKDECIGKIDAESLYYRLINGPCIMELEFQAFPK